MSELGNTRLIGSELSRLSNPDEADISCGFLRVQSVNQALLEASMQPNPKQLFLSLWNEGELCCLFADSNLGKSVLSVQICSAIAETGKRVLLFDFEMSSKMFSMRYSDDSTGELHKFPDNFYRAELSSELMAEAKADNFEKALMQYIEASIIRTKCEVIAIDNLSWMCSASEQGADAGLLMIELMRLKRQYHLSVLVVSHTPKRGLGEPLTQNSLAGSKRLFNFFDSCFALGRSAKDSNILYLKQLKVRTSAFEYGADNVILYHLDKVDGFLQFILDGFGCEEDHLRTYSEADRASMIEEAKRLSGQGMSQRAIASQLGISVGAVNKYLNR